MRWNIQREQNMMKRIERRWRLLEISLGQAWMLLSIRNYAAQGRNSDQRRERCPGEQGGEAAHVREGLRLLDDGTCTHHLCKFPHLC